MEYYVCKETTVLTAVLFVFLFFTIGCENPNSPNQENMYQNDNVHDEIIIPCLVYEENGYVIDSLVASWNTSAGTLNISEKKAYSFNKNDEVRCFTWNGNDCFLLSDTCVPSSQYLISTELFPLDAKSKQEVLFGDNIKLFKKLPDEPNVYSIQTEIDGQIQTKDIQLKDTKYQDSSGKYYDLNPFDLSFTYADGVYAYFIFIRPIDHENKFIVIKYNLASNESMINIISSDSQLTPSSLFLQKDVVNINERFYSHTDKGIGALDLVQSKFTYLIELSQECWSFIPSTIKSDIYISSLSVIGAYNDILLVSVPVNTGKSDESLICATRDNKIIGAIYRHDHIMQFYDKDKNLKSELNFEGNIGYGSQLIFPTKNNTNLR